VAIAAKVMVVAMQAEAIEAITMVTERARF